MSDNDEEKLDGLGAEVSVNADAIVEAFSDDGIVEEDDVFVSDYSDDDDDPDFLDTNIEIMNHDKHW